MSEKREEKQLIGDQLERWQDNDMVIISKSDNTEDVHSKGNIDKDVVPKNIVGDVIYRKNIDEVNLKGDIGDNVITKSNNRWRCSYSKRSYSKLWSSYAYVHG